MLSLEQRLAFCMATAIWHFSHDNEPSRLVDLEDVVGTMDTIESFLHGAAKDIVSHEIDTPYGVLHCWQNVVKHSDRFGRRGTLFVVDFGNVRAAHFELNGYGEI
jgi:hypothetical protein